MRRIAFVIPGVALCLKWSFLAGREGGRENFLALRVGPAAREAAHRRRTIGTMREDRL